MPDFGSALWNWISGFSPKAVIYLFWDTVEIRLPDSFFQIPGAIEQIQYELKCSIFPIGMDLKIKPLSYQQSYTTGIILLNVNRPYLGEIKP